MIGAMARHRVQVPRAGGKTLRRTAAETGIPLLVRRLHLPTVRRHYPESELQVEAEDQPYHDSSPPLWP